MMSVVKKITACFIAVVFVVLLPAAAFATESYIFNRAQQNLWVSTQAPLPYRFVRSVTADDIGTANLSGITSVCFYGGSYYVTCGSSLIVTDGDFKAVKTITSLNGEALTALNGLFITNAGEIYLCEPNKSRVWHLNADFSVNRVLGRPEGITIRDTAAYMPMKVAVDSNGRIYVIANGVYEGIVEMNPDGTFNRFYGVVKVKYTVSQLFWRAIRTEAQKTLSTLWLPVNFSYLTVDNEDFVYGTVADAKNAGAVKKLNAKGTDILRRPKVIKDNFDVTAGDIFYNSFGIGVPIGPSVLAAVDVTDYGVYYVFDQTRNRAFAYDEDGYLLFAFGGSGNKEGLLKSVSDMTLVGDDILFVDKGNASIEVFTLTDYGRAILDASKKQHASDFMGAAEDWARVLEYNPYFQYAYVGVGKALYRQGDYAEAAVYFQKGQDAEYYSMAYKKTRGAFMEKYFTAMVIGAAALAALGIALMAYKRARKGARRDLA